MDSNQSKRYCQCGIRLARDNPDSRCSACQRKARDRALHPPEVPAEFWETDQLRDAFAGQHMGQVIRAYRHHPFHGTRVLSQELVAGWLGITQTQLSRLESGRPVRDLDRLVRWAQTLRIPARHLWFDLPGQRRGAAEHVEHGAATHQPLVIADLTDLLHLLDAGIPLMLSAAWSPSPSSKVVPVDRRHLTKAVLTAPLIPAAVQARLADEARFPVDATLVDAYERTAARLAGKYIAHDPNALAPEAATYADRALALLDRPMAGELRHRLSAVAVSLCAQTGLLALHTATTSQARRYLALARDAAADSQDPTLSAQALGASSELHSPLTYGGNRGNPERAVTMLDQAIANMGKADGHTQGWLYLWRADAASDAEDIDTAWANVERAHQALATVAGSGQGLFSPAGLFRGLNGRAGLTHSQALTQTVAGRYGEADPALVALSQRMTGRGYVIVMCDLAAVRVAAGEPEGACQALGDALDRALAAGYTRGIERILGVRGRFHDTWAQLECVRALDDQLRLALLPA